MWPFNKDRGLPIWGLMQPKRKKETLASYSEKVILKEMRHNQDYALKVAERMKRLNMSDEKPLTIKEQLVEMHDMQMLLAELAPAQSSDESWAKVLIKELGPLLPALLGGMKEQMQQQQQQIPPAQERPALTEATSPVTPATPATPAVVASVPSLDVLESLLGLPPEDALSELQDMGDVGRYVIELFRQKGAAGVVDMAVHLDGEIAAMLINDDIRPWLDTFEQLCKGSEGSGVIHA